MLIPACVDVLLRMKFVERCHIPRHIGIFGVPSDEELELRMSDIFSGSGLDKRLQGTARVLLCGYKQIEALPRGRICLA